MPIGLAGESRKSSTSTDSFGTTCGMQMIADQFGDGGHKSIPDIFGGQ